MTESDLQNEETKIIIVIEDGAVENAAIIDDLRIEANIVDHIRLIRVIDIDVDRIVDRLRMKEDIAK